MFYFTNNSMWLDYQVLNYSIMATSHTSRDCGIVRAQKKVSRGPPNTPSKSCSVVTDPQV